jgi:peptidoglycan hydrolase-like protein with peptidoglycan-binding domain
VPHVDLSEATPWLESKRRSRARRGAALRARRLRRSGRSGLLVLGASLTLAAGGAFAAQGTGGATPATPAPAAPAVSVAAVQKVLGITADGVAGPQTRRAIKRFQRANGLKVTGVAGTDTLNALGLGTSTASTMATTSTSSGDDADTLAKIAECESGGDPTIVSPSGQYRGKYQFSRATWRAMGGTGDPAKADEATQDAIAAKLLAARGTAPWPNCA